MDYTVKIDGRGYNAKFYLGLPENERAARMVANKDAKDTNEAGKLLAKMQEEINKREDEEKKAEERKAKTAAGVNTGEDEAKVITTENAPVEKPKTK